MKLFSQAITALGAPLILVSAWMQTAKAFDADFVLPPACIHGTTASGYATETQPEPNPVDRQQPIVTIVYENSMEQIRYVVPEKTGQIFPKTWATRFISPEDGDYILLSECTPFLVSYRVIHARSGRMNQYTLATPGYVEVSDDYTLFARVTGTAKKYANGSFGFIPIFRDDTDGTPEYTVQIDGNGNFYLECFLYADHENSITVYDAEHNYVGEGTLVVAKQSQEGYSIYGEASLNISEEGQK